MKIWEKVKRFVKSVASDDPASWGSHWALVVIGSILPALIVGALIGVRAGTVAGFIASEIWLLVFTVKETQNWKDHLWAGDDLSRWRRDGIRDYAGPLVNHLAWWWGVWTL